MNNYYTILGVSESATKQDIEKAHKKLYVQNHPDRFRDPKKKEEAEKKCKQINEAYQTLIDPKKRNMYDLERSGGHSKFNQGGDFNFEFDFADLWGQKPNRKSQKFNLDIELTYNISVKNAYYGEKKEVKYKRKNSCKVCNQTGYFGQHNCKQCRGTGYINAIITTFLCSKCNGSGISGTACTNCLGNGFVEQTYKCILLIPAKVSDKQILTFDNQGHKFKNVVGKLHVTICLQKCDNVSWDEYGNLYLEKEIKLEDVLKRKPIIVHLFNEVITVDLPYVLTSKTVLKVKSKGLKYKNVDQSLNITLVINYPIEG